MDLDRLPCLQHDGFTATGASRDVDLARQHMDPGRLLLVENLDAELGPDIGDVALFGADDKALG